MIEKFSELNYTIHMSFLTGAKPLRKGAAGCCFGPAHRGRATPHEGLVQGAGRSCLADPAGPEYAAAAGHVPGRSLVGGEQLELAGMGVPAGHPAGPCLRGAELLVFCQGTPGPRQKGKTEAGGVQLTSVNITGGSPL